MQNKALALLLGAAVLVAMRKKRRRFVVVEHHPPIGIELEGGRLRISDWNVLMRAGARQVKRAVAEGADTPDEIVARMFYRAMPQHDWPPKPGSPLADQYGAIVNLVAATVDGQLRPEREGTVRRGLRVVR